MQEKHMPDSNSFHAKANLAEACTGDSPIQDGLRPGMTVKQILADPMVRAVMLADHVEPDSFVTLLRSVARTRGRQANPCKSRSSSAMADTGCQPEAVPGQPSLHWSTNDKRDQRRDVFPIRIERN
ncbi:MAG: hypothetical protein P4L90_14615 [Rhodopila sp.]|nr:hypothetical protein [Rhodopila sp.]